MSLQHRVCFATLGIRLRLWPRVRGAGVLFALGIAALSSLKVPVHAEPAGASQLIECRSSVSLEGRLSMQQWSAAGQCDRPSRIRITDRYLGFTCSEDNGQATGCRPYLPGSASRGFATGKSFRCVDVGVVGSEEGVLVSRMREWAAPERQCDWNPYAQVLALEIDFDNGQVCIAAICISADRLSVIGRLRLQHSIRSAFRELNLTAQLRPAVSGKSGAREFR